MKSGGVAPSASAMLICFPNKEGSGMAFNYSWACPLVGMISFVWLTQKVYCLCCGRVLFFRAIQA